MTNNGSKTEVQVKEQQKQTRYYQISIGKQEEYSIIETPQNWEATIKDQPQEKLGNFPTNCSDKDQKTFSARNRTGKS